MPQSDGPWTVERVLTWTRGFFERRGVESPRLCAELILAHVLAASRIKLYTDYQRPLAAEELAKVRDLVKRAGDDEPIAYLTGRAHFYNLEFDVTRDTLIPRPDTETIVEQAMTLFRHTPGFETPRVLDLCTGSGCVAVAIAFHGKTSHVIATDVSDKALAVAKVNAERNNVADRVTFLQGDLLAALDGHVGASPFDLLTANPPYVATSQLAGLPRNVRDYEPRLALDGGPDGLAFHRRILQDAAPRVRPGGRLLLEIAFDQRDAALALASEFDAYDDARVLRDHAGQMRVLHLARAS